MISIYDYLSAEVFVADAWKWKKERNAQLSVRAWAKQLGMKYHSPLHQIILGNRKIPKHYVPLLAMNLKLNKKESLYLETLIDLHKAKTSQEKEIYGGRLSTLSPKPLLKSVQIESYKYFQDPLHGIILEMSLLKNFVGEPQWIQARVGFKVSLADIKITLERLLSLGFLIINSDGKLVKVNQHLFSTSDVPNKYLQEYHARCSDMAKSSLEIQDVLEREFNASTFNLAKKDIPRAKEMLRRFLNDFITEIEAPAGDGEETYHVNLQLFKITR